MSFAICRRCWFTSMAKIVVAPTARATAMENNPIGPQPVIATVLAAIAPARNLSFTCTASYRVRRTRETSLKSLPMPSACFLSRLNRDWPKSVAPTQTSSAIH